MIKKLQNYHLLILMLPFFVLADDSDLFDLSLEELMQIRVVTAASGFEQSVKQAPSSVTIIEAAEWKARGAKNLTQALLGASNIEINTITNGVNHPKYTIRGLSGIYGQQVVILIDGIPVNTLHTGSGTSLSETPLQGYKRIEIIRSPGSVVYGADAFGGIINLVSYDINEQPDEVIITAGEFEALNLGVNSSFSLAGMKFQISANYQKFGDDPERIITSDLQTTLDGIFNTSVSNAPGSLTNNYESFAIKGKLEWQALSVFYNAIQGDYGFGAGVAQSLDPKGNGHYKKHIAGFDYDLSSLIEGTPFNGDFLLSAWTNHQETNTLFTIFPAGTILPIGSDGNVSFSAPTSFTTFTDGYIGAPGYKTDRYHFSVKHLFVIDNNHQIRWEVGFEKQDYTAFEKKNFGPTVLDGTETVVDGALTDVTKTPYVFMPPNKRDFIFVSFQDQWSVTESVQLNVGARFDDYSDSGSTFNPRLGLNWMVTDKFKVRLFSGTAFRSPTFVDLYAQNNPEAEGNTDVKPEEIITYELGGDYQFTDNLRSVITVFSYRANNLIDYVPDVTASGRKAKNVGQQQAVGFEWEMHWRPLNSVDISSNYSYTDSKDGKNHHTTNIAKQLAAFIVNWQITEHININLASNWVMDRERSEEDIRPPLKDYAMVTSKLSYAGAVRGLTLSVSVNNVLDEDIRHPSNGTIADDFPQAGRQWLAEIEYNF